MGKYECQRLPFGIASAPAIFQRYLTQILQGIPGAFNFLDGVLVSGKTLEDNHANLESILKVLQKTDLRLI